MEKATCETIPKQQEENKSTIEGKPTVDRGTSSTEDATKARPMVEDSKNVNTLSQRLQRLSVSPPRQRSGTSPTVSLVGGRTTPPPGAHASTRGSKPATPQSTESGLPRTHSSPSLLDASPKSATGSQTGSSSGPPPRMVTSRPSPRETSPAVLRPAPVVHHELTPVTRNTSETSQFVEDDDHVIVVSPEEQQLHGEHLALPSGVDYDGGAPPHSLQHPLHQRRFSYTDTAAPPYLPVSSRSSISNHNDLAHAARQHLSQQGILGNSWDGTYSDQNDEDDDDDHEHIGGPVQFPKQKFYSFNSRQQYKAAVEQERGAFMVPQQQQQHATSSHPQSQHGLKPYQPTRNDMANVGLKREETSSIFLPRRDVDSSRGSSGTSLNAIPLGERQWSIPSIRMANHVQGSTTDYTDEEDDLFRGYDDDASLSSRGSSLYLPDESLEAERIAASTTPSSSSNAIVIEDGMDRVFHEDCVRDASAVAVAPTELDFQDDDDDDDDEREGLAPVLEKSPREERRKKRTKKNEKERQAYEWLRTVELGPENTVFCEAASSKFLTAGALGKSPPLNRSDSSPATISTGRRDGNILGIK